MATPVPSVFSWETLVATAAMTAATALGLLIFVLLQAWGYVARPRPLGLGGERTTFRHAAVVMFCAMAILFRAAVLARHRAAEGNLGVLGAAMLSYALVLPIHLVVTYRGDRLQVVEAIQLLTLCHVSWAVVDLGAALGIGLLLRFPVVAVAAVPIGVAVALGVSDRRSNDRRLLEAYASSSASDGIDRDPRHHA